MEPVQLAAVLAGVVLVASIVSVELGVTVALLELTLGVVVGNVFHLHSQEWLDFIAVVRLDRPDVPGRDGGRPRLHARPARRRPSGSASCRSSARSSSPSLVAYVLLDWTAEGVADRGNRALDDVARGRLRRPRRARADRHGDRQAADERDLRHRPLHGARALGDLHQAERLVPGLPRRLARADPRPAQARAVVLRPLRRPRDRAGDQARLRLPARPDGARRRLERPRRAARVRARPRDEPPLPSSTARSRSACASSRSPS